MLCSSFGGVYANYITIMMYEVSRKYIINENKILYLMLCTIVITIDQTVINGKYDSYKYYKNILNNT